MGLGVPLPVKEVEEAADGAHPDVHRGNLDPVPPDIQGLEKEDKLADGVLADRTEVDRAVVLFQPAQQDVE